MKTAVDCLKTLAQYSEMMAEGSFDCYWEEVLFRMRPVRIIAKDSCGQFWADIDRLEDYERILSHLNGEKIS